MSRIVAFVAGSWKPGNVRLASMPGGGTSPSREPVGKIASAANAAGTVAIIKSATKKVET